MVSPRPQTFVPGAYWPPWAVQESFETAAWKHALQSGFDAAVKTGKHSIVLTCKTPLCPFSVKILKDDDTANTSEVELKHSHTMLDFTHLDTATSEAKKVHKKCTAALYSAVDALQKKAIAEVTRYRVQADNQAMSTFILPGETTELSPTTGQEGIFWELADALGQERARELEDALRRDRQLTDLYPSMSTFDGKTSPFDAPPDERFAPSSPARSPDTSFKPVSIDPQQKEKKEKRQDEAASQKKPKKRKLPVKSGIDGLEAPHDATTPSAASNAPSTAFAAFASKSKTPSSSPRKKTLIDFSGVSPFAAKSTPTRRVSKEEQDVPIGLRDDSSRTKDQLATAPSKTLTPPGLFDGSMFFEDLLSPSSIRANAPSPTLLVKKEADTATPPKFESAQQALPPRSSAGQSTGLASPAPSAPPAADECESAEPGTFIKELLPFSANSKAGLPSIFTSESKADDDLNSYLNNLPNSKQFAFCDRYRDKLVDAQIETGQQLQVIAQHIPDELKETLSLGTKDLVYAIFERALAAQREAEVERRS